MKQRYTFSRKSPEKIICDCFTNRHWHFYGWARCPYIVYTVAPTGIQLFVEELFSFSLLKIFGLLLHCEGLPLWNRQQHTFSSSPLPLNLLDSCCSRTSTNNNKNHALVLSTFKSSCAEGREEEEIDTVWTILSGSQSYSPCTAAGYLRF